MFSSTEIDQILHLLLDEAQGEPARIVKLTDDIWPQVADAVIAVFHEYAGWVVGYVQEYMDPDLSVAVLQGDQVMGFYLLGRRQVTRCGLQPTEDLSPYRNKRGVEGVALGVLPEARGAGLGNQLKDYPKSLGVDYVWGLQMESLQNLQHWLKRRRVVAQGPGMFATLEDFK